MNPARTGVVPAVCRAVIGVTVLVAVGVQFAALTPQANFQPANFFSYFTNLTNIFAALVFMYVALTFGKSSRGLDVVRGAATLCLGLTGVVFSLLLANVESDIIPWVNVIVHYVMPVAVVADWIIDPPHRRLTLRDAGFWLIIPLAYVIYTLVRGSIVHWYPYPFLNVDAIGSATVGVYVAAIFVFTVMFAALVLVTGNALQARRGA
jgi:hypothetical protein